MPMPASPKTYEIVHRARGLFFVCIACGHELVVNDFPAARAPNKRTQAAAAMKAHHEQTHKAAR